MTRLEHADRWIFIGSLILSLIAIILLRTVLSAWAEDYRQEITAALLGVALLGFLTCVVGAILHKVIMMDSDVSVYLYTIGASMLTVGIVTPIGAFA